MAGGWFRCVFSDVLSVDVVSMLNGAAAEPFDVYGLYGRWFFGFFFCVSHSVASFWTL